MHGSNNRSLMDDDGGDKIVDYFGTGDIGSVTSSNFSRCNVKEHTVRALPSFCPIEQSAIFVTQASAPVLAA